MYSKTQCFFCSEFSFILNDFISPDFKVSLSITISSPGFTSRKNDADCISNAQVSDATRNELSSLPKANGRNPSGSRAAISLSSVSITTQ